MDVTSHSITLISIIVGLGLTERPGQLVEKQQLMTALWPETVVEEANLAYTMSALRRALGDGEDGNQGPDQTSPLQRAPGFPYGPNESRYAPLEQRADSFGPWPG
jgi:hypothetical protein